MDPDEKIDCLCSLYNYCTVDSCISIKYNLNKLIIKEKEKKKKKIRANIRTNKENEDNS